MGTIALKGPPGSPQATLLHGARGAGGIHQGRGRPTRQRPANHQEAQKAGATTVKRLLKARRPGGLRRAGTVVRDLSEQRAGQSPGDCRHVGHSGEIGRALRLQPLPGDAVWNTVMSRYVSDLSTYNTHHKDGLQLITITQRIYGGERYVAH